jgi:hypothetical protein
MSRVTNLNSDDHVRLSAGMSGMKIKMIITDYRKLYLSFFYRNLGLNINGIGNQNKKTIIKLKKFGCYGV